MNPAIIIIGLLAIAAAVWAWGHVVGGEIGDGERCEGCGDPATQIDEEGVRLCDACADLEDEG